MKKNYRIFSFALLLLIGMAINVAAQTTAYASLKSTTNDWKEGYGFNGCVVAFDIADPSTVDEVVFKVEPIDGQYGEEAVFVQAGASAADKYYAMCKSEYDGEHSFCTLNFATGKRTIIGTGYDYLNDMAYNPSNEVLYGIEYILDGTTDYSTLSSINKGTGALAPVFDITGVQVVGIATDGGEKLYGVGVEKGDNKEMIVSLYLIDPAKKEAKELYHAIGTIGSSYSYTLDYNEGKLYFISGLSFATIDPENGTMAVSEKKLPQNALVGLCFTKSTADGTASEIEEPDPSAPVAKVRVVETWGDILDEEPGKLTNKKVTYYDADNKPVRTCSYGKLLGKDEYQISRFMTYVYNDKKQLIQTSSEQYGLYDGEDLAFKAVADTVFYEYDDKGLMVKETTLTGGYISYEYDAIGNLVRKARWNFDRYDEYEGDYYIVESYEYSDFVALDCPQTIKGDGAYESYKNLCYITYDDGNHKLSAKTYDVSGEVLQKAEYWAYENEILTLYEQKKVKKVGEAYEEQDYKKTVYSLENDNPNRMKEENFSFSNGEWSGSVVYKVTESADYSSLFAAELSVEEVPDAINTVKLTFTVPNVPASGGMAFDIYRHGIKIARVLPSDEGAYDPDTQTISYVDHDVKNGLYDYFVQTVLLSELEDEEAAFNVSNIVQQKVYVELPVVTNIHYISHETKDGLYVVKVGWDAPENVPEALGFQKYNLFVKGYKIPENSGVELTETNYDVTFGDVTSQASKAKEITLESVFRYGKVKSEPTVVSIILDGIENNEDNNLVLVTGDRILVNNDHATVDIIALNGTVLNSYQDIRSIDLSALDKGIYLAKVVCDGKTYLLKLIK